MLLDANLLLYAVDSTSPRHEAALDWLSGELSSGRRVALSAMTISAFVRIATHPRVFEHPLTADAASDLVDAWLAVPTVWVPPMGEVTLRHFSKLVRDARATANLIPDALLAALAIEHGLEIASVDTDFARFSGVRWTNPLV
jgi:toxin-antitoxin system PIN domain toxin